MIPLQQKPKKKKKKELAFSIAEIRNGHSGDMVACLPQDFLGMGYFQQPEKANNRLLASFPYLVQG